MVQLDFNVLGIKQNMEDFITLAEASVLDNLLLFNLLEESDEFNKNLRINSINQ